MCGRYHFELIKGSKIEQEAKKALQGFKTGDVCPGDRALLITEHDRNHIGLSTKKWGIEASGLVINARIETLKERKMFKAHYDKRCVVVANGFYEWKEQNRYYIDTPSSYIYLAAFFNDRDEFVIITKESGTRLAKIHPRSPLIMDEELMLRYLFKGEYRSMDEEKLKIKGDAMISLF